MGRQTKREGHLFAVVGPLLFVMAGQGYVPSRSAQAVTVDPEKSSRMGRDRHLVVATHALNHLRARVRNLLKSGPTYQWGDDQRKIEFNNERVTAGALAQTFSQLGDPIRAKQAANLHADLVRRTEKSETGSQGYVAVRNALIVDLSQGNLRRVRKYFGRLMEGDVALSRLKDKPRDQQLQRQWNLHQLEREAAALMQHLDRAVEAYRTAPKRAGADCRQVDEFLRHADRRLKREIRESEECPAAYRSVAIKVPDSMKSWNEPWPGFNPPVIIFQKRIDEWRDYGLAGKDGACDPPIFELARSLRPEAFGDDLVYDHRGWARHPNRRWGVAGLGEWKQWAENKGADGVFLFKTPDGLFLPLYQRTDNGQLSIPGGPRRYRESAPAAVLRHAKERAGLDLDGLAIPLTRPVWRGVPNHSKDTVHAWYGTQLFAHVATDVSPEWVMRPLTPTFPYAMRAGFYRLTEGLIHRLHTGDGTLVKRAIERLRIPVSRDERSFDSP